MDLMKWRPRSLFLDMFDDIFADALKPWSTFTPSNLKPAVDIYEKDNKIIVKASLPGMKKDDIDITVEDGVLTLKGEIKKEDEIKEENYFKKERYFGTFQRSFALGDGVDYEQINASYKDGVLNIEIPKKAEPAKEVKKIEIK